MLQITFLTTLCIDVGHYYIQLWIFIQIMIYKYPGCIYAPWMHPAYMHTGGRDALYTMLDGA